MVCTAFKRFSDDLIPVFMGKKNTGNFREMFPNGSEYVHPIGCRHIIFGNDGIIRRSFEMVKGIRCRKGCLYPDIRVTFQKTLCRVQEDRVIIYVKD
jgi:hypothetical protein